MLGVAVTCCSSSPGPLLPSCWSSGQCQGTWGLCSGRGTGLPPSHLQVQPAAKLSTWPRETHTDTCRALTRLVPRTATAFSGAYTRDPRLAQAQAAMSPPPLGLAETKGHSCRHTHESLWMHEHMRGPSLCPVPLPRSQPSYLPQGLPTCWLVQLDVCCKHIAFILILQAHHAHRSLWITAQILACLIPLPGPSVSYSPASPA